ncbi:MAG: MOSC domain-containing protein [Acidimicrobiales bacterium]
MDTSAHRTRAELDAELDRLHASPRRRGTVELIVRRPSVDERETLDQGELVVGQGLKGDSYPQRGSSSTDDGGPHPEAQLNIMNARAIDIICNGDKQRWPIAGDQFFVDLDLSVDHLPTGTRLAIGDAEIEISAKPHTGCAKFRARFGLDAWRWANTTREERRRGLNAMVVKPGVVRTGDAIVVLD